MLALSPEPGELRCFGLDRIADLSPSPRSLVPPASFDAAAYYAQAFGIRRPDDEEPQEIVLSLTLTQGRYVQTFPLHSSQRLLSATAGSFIVRPAACKSASSAPPIRSGNGGFNDGFPLVELSNRSSACPRPLPPERP